MKRMLVTVLALGLSLPGLAAAQQPQQPATGATRVAIIDIQAAIVNTNEGAREFEALQKRFEPKQNELQKLQTELENLRKQLQEQEGKLSQDERGARVRTIESRERNLQRTLEDAQNDFQAAQAEVVNRIGTRLLQIIEQHAQKNNFGLVIDVSNPQASGVLWASPETNITRDVVDAYNAQSGVQPPAASAPSAARPQQQPQQQQRPQSNTPR